MDQGMTIEQARSIGRSMASNAAKAGMRPPAFSRDEMRVTAVRDDGRLDLDNGSEGHPMPVNGVPMTTACEDVRVGDTVVVDTFMNRPLVTGVISGNRHYVKLRTGTMVLTAGDTGCRMWTEEEFREQFGRHFDVSRDFVGVMNGDGNATITHVQGATSHGGDGIYAVFDRKVVGLIRVTYLVALG